MKYIFILALLIGCTKSRLGEPELHYGQAITIKNGFFKGCKGEVKGINNLAGCYEVRLEYACGYKEPCLLYDKPEQWR